MMNGDGEKELELMVWKGDWGLPSVDHQCLAALVSEGTKAYSYLVLQLSDIHLYIM